jgi:hypothetical protein
MNKDEALRLALEVLQDYVEEYGPHEKDSGAAYAITAIKQALEQPEPEPVAWLSDGGDVSRSKRYMDEMGFKCRPLYTSPPKREPLTHEQDRAICEGEFNAASDEYFKARPDLDTPVNRRIFYAGHRKAWVSKDQAIEAAHGIGEKK